MIVRAVLTLMVGAAVALQGGYPTRLSWGFLLGLTVMVTLICARMVLKSRRRATEPGLLGSARRRVEGALAAIRRARRRARVRRVEEAAALAADKGNELLSPERVRVAAETLLRLFLLAWNARDPGRLATLLGPELLPEWELRLADAIASGRDERREVVGDLRIEYVGFTADEPVDCTRVVVLIEAVLAKHTRHHAAPQQGEQRLCQYWTLGFSDGAWTVLQIEERHDGEHHLSEPVGSAIRS